MTKETKRIFNAPFAVIGDSTDYTKFNVIIHDRKSQRYCSTVASCIDQKTAIRFSRLPELYDALVEAVYDACQDCLVERSYVIKEKDYDLIKNGCIYPERDCCEQCRKWIELIRKVRNGE